MTEDKLLAEMQALRDRITGITGTAVASRDGLIIREDTGGVNPDNLAALTSAALSLAQRLVREAGQGTLREAVTRSSGGYVAIYAVGPSAVLVLLGDEGLDVTRLHRVVCQVDCRQFVGFPGRTRHGQQVEVVVIAERGSVAKCVSYDRKAAN